MLDAEETYLEFYAALWISHHVIVHAVSKNSDQFWAGQNIFNISDEIQGTTIQLQYKRNGLTNSRASWRHVKNMDIKEREKQK